MSNIGGLEVLRSIRARTDAPRTILHSAYLDVPTTVAAMRIGVEDVVEKSVSLTLLTDRVFDLANQRRTARRTIPPPHPPSAGKARDPAARLFGETDSVKAVREQIHRISSFGEVAVLIEGETGTGKELIAQAIHELSAPDEPFIAVNCAAIPPHLFESELFGHEAGAFTSAKGTRVGLLEDAGRGTIFLDEIGEMPMSVQPKLLRVLETREFRRVGGNRNRKLAARVISATNRSLRRASEDIFRSDLYFRLAGYAIFSPPLRERIEDLPLLARKFLDHFAERYGFAKVAISDCAIEALRRHDWPGNLRELRLVVENAAILASPHPIDAKVVEHILATRTGRFTQKPGEAPGLLCSPSQETAPPRDGMSLPDVERELIIEAFSQCSNNLTWAAKRLGIPRSTLRDRLRKLGVR
jgi:two-component system response regulator AtoC